MSYFQFNPNAPPFYPQGSQLNPNAGTFYPPEFPAVQPALQHLPADPLERRGLALGRTTQQRRMGRVLGDRTEPGWPALPARKLAGFISES
ncbi:hypothetical protein PG987_001056 [Apiospora arundinis]